LITKSVVVGIKQMTFLHKEQPENMNTCRIRQ